MIFKGKPWNPDSMIHALEAGIGMIVQESGIIPGITVAENVYFDLDGVLVSTDEYH